MMDLEHAMAERLEGTFTPYAGAPDQNQFPRVSCVSTVCQPVENPAMPLTEAPHRDSILTLNHWANTWGNVTLMDIKIAVSRHYSIPVNEIISARRESRLVRCRMAYYWLARELTPASFPMIGRHCGNRDHTTVMSGLKNVKRFWPQFERVIAKLKGELKP